MSNNKLEKLTKDVFLLKDFNAAGNPLVDIPPAYRSDKDKVYPLANMT
jgi:hypothetical protein